MLTLRHNEDWNFQRLLKTDIVTLTLNGRQQGAQYYFEGGAPQLPGVAFHAAMTPNSEERCRPSLRSDKAASATKGDADCITLAAINSAQRTTSGHPFRLRPPAAARTAAAVGGYSS